MNAEFNPDGVLLGLTPADALTLCGHLIDDLHRNRQTLLASFADFDADVAIRSAHSLGSAAANAGDLSFCALAHQVEDLIRLSDWTAADERVRTLSEAADILVEILEEWRTSHPCTAPAVPAAPSADDPTRVKALVCDDDASTRFLVRRMLEESIGCSVTECADGVQALKSLASDRFGFVVLDIDMPIMNGHETLEEIRHSVETRDIPVIALSRERQEESVMRLMRLGIADYLVKPLHRPVAVAKIEKLVRLLPRAGTEARSLDRLRLRHDVAALVVDGNPEFRGFAAAQLRRYGPVVEADCGAAALAAARRSSFGVVFVGSDLGLVGAERLVGKLREIMPGGVRIVGLTEGETTGRSIFDARLRRVYSPDTFRNDVRPFVFIPGPLAALGRLVPELPAVTTSAATQTFGMMFNSEIAPSPAAAGSLDVAFSAAIDMVLQSRFAVTVGIHLPKATALAVASKMVGVDPSELVDDDCLSVAGELTNIIVGRVHAHCRERSLSSVCSLPRLQPAELSLQPDEVSGFAQPFATPENGDFLITVIVRDTQSDASGAGADATGGADAVAPAA